jgi:hypothetical protein
VRSSIARRLGLDFGGNIKPSRDINGVMEMMLDATPKYAEPLTTERLFSWHASLFPTRGNGMRRVTVGAWRPPDIGPMQVVSSPNPDIRKEVSIHGRLLRRDDRATRSVDHVPNAAVRSSV